MHPKAKRLTGKHPASKLFWSANQLVESSILMKFPAKAQSRNEDLSFPVNRSSLRLCAFAGVIIFSLLVARPIAAQSTTQPEREELLNGLRLLFWPQPGRADVVLKPRINSGAAFDLAGKSGQMALLGDLLFPDPATIDYFTDEMGGKLNVNVSYDSTTITLVGKADQLEHIVEVLR